VTTAIALVTFAIWAVIALFQLGLWALVNGAFIPARLTMDFADGSLIPFWLTPISAALLHAGALHLAFNLLILVYCGRPVEAALGPVGLIILYLIGAYAAAAAQFAIDPHSLVPMIGASGAISAVIGAFSMLFGRNKLQGRVANPRLARWLNALWLMVAWVVLQIALAIAASASFDGIQLAAAAHIGGFLAGILLANPLLLFRYRKA
jgi:membrane associated rhomboid family serine protease